MDKTVVELFAGVGGFRCGLNHIKKSSDTQKDEEWETLWFSQWEPADKKIQWAHDCYVNHFGSCLDINGNDTTNDDIHSVDKKTLPNHTLLVGGFPCLTSDTLILTKEGYKKIVDIKEGDYVLSHDSKFHKVLNFYPQGKKPIFEVKSYGMDTLKLTNNHKLYVREEINRKLKAPQWLSIEEIANNRKRRYFLGAPINHNSVLPKWNGIEININQFKTKRVNELKMEDCNLWYLAGRYVGDGWIRKQQKDGVHRNSFDGVIICCGKNKSEELKSKIPDNMNYTLSEERTCFRFIFAKHELTAFMMQFGMGAANKHIPGFMFDMPIKQLKSFLDGYRDSDGYIHESDKYHYVSFSSISRELIYGVTQLIQKVYEQGCEIYSVKGRGKIIIENRIVNESTCYYTKYKTKEIHKYWKYENNYIWYPITDIIDTNIEEEVYDIEVETSHSFIANNCVSHNCQNYSVASTLATSKGIEGTKGVLWWDIRDILEIKQPPFVLLENVDRLLKSPAKQRGRDFGIILACFRDLGYTVEWRVINAAEYGYQQRRRRTFIFAYKNNTKFASSLNDTNAKEIINKKGFFAQSFKIEPAEIVKTCVFKDTVGKVSDKFSFNFENTGLVRDGIIYTVKTTPVSRKKQKTLGSLLEKEKVDEKYFIPEDRLYYTNPSVNHSDETEEKLSAEAHKTWQYIKGAKKMYRKSANGYEYVYSEGPVPMIDEYDKPARTMLTSEGSFSRTTHIIKDKITGDIRLLTPKETERIQGFPDDWTKYSLVNGQEIEMPDNKRRFMMGNALVVDLIEQMEKTLSKIVENE